jgi:hypothetical protein
LHQLLQRFQEPGFRLDLRLAAAARSTNAACQLGILAAQLRKTTAYSAASDTRRLGNRPDAAPARRTSLGCGEQTPPTLVEIRRQRIEPRLDSDDVDHSGPHNLIGRLNQTISTASSPLTRADQLLTAKKRQVSPTQNLDSLITRQVLTS